MSYPGPSHSRPARNPGPSWGYRFLRLANHVLPEFIFRPVRALGTWIAMAGMPRQRRHSRDYLRIVLGREPRLREVFRHFFEFEEMLMLKLRVADGHPHRCVISPDARDLRRFLDSDEDALLGTVHVGHSDLMGFLVAREEQRHVTMVRLRVGNSHDVDTLARAVGPWLSFVWVNEGENLLFALKDAIAAGGSLALKCDRLEFSSRAEPFQFLGARRLFPFTIHHLAIIFNRPVLFSVGVPDRPGQSIVYGSTRWAPDPALSRADNLASARVHFQEYLDLVESVIRKNPYWWFNYLPLNPVAPDPGRESATTASAPLPSIRGRYPA